MPYIRFLFVRPRICRRLPSDSPHGGHPCLKLTIPTIKARSGLTPYSCCPCGANMVQQGTACRYPASLVIFYHNSSAEKSPKKKYSNEIICNKIHRPATKHIVNIIIFFTPLYFFFLNKKSSNSEIAMSIIFIAPAIISIVYNFVVITNGLVRNSV